MVIKQQYLHILMLMIGFQQLLCNGITADTQYRTSIRTQFDLVKKIEQEINKKLDINITNIQIIPLMSQKKNQI